MKKKNNLATAAVTQNVIKAYTGVPHALVMEVRMMEQNPEDRDNKILLPYYKAALEIILNKVA